MSGSPATVGWYVFRLDNPRAWVPVHWDGRVWTGVPMRTVPLTRLEGGEVSVFACDIVGIARGADGATTVTTEGGLRYESALAPHTLSGVVNAMNTGEADTEGVYMHGMTLAVRVSWVPGMGFASLRQALNTMQHAKFAYTLKCKVPKRVYQNESWSRRKAWLVPKLQRVPCPE